MDKVLEHTFLHKRQKGDQLVFESIVNITKHQENQIKTTMRCYLISTRMDTIKNTQNNKRCQGCGEIGILVPTGGIVK